MSECVLWTRGTDSYGYGSVRLNGKVCKAHRLAFIEAHGEIPKGLVVRHSCDNRLCVNPNHLILGTQKDNIADMVSRGRQRGAIGICNAKAKLTEDTVRLIHDDPRSCVALGEAFGVSKSLVSQIKRKEIWRHLWE